MDQSPSRHVGVQEMSAQYPYSLEAHAEGQSAQIIQIDIGKHLAAVIALAAICGGCLAITVGTVWHSKEREVETQARIRVLQNHVDEATNEVKRLKDRLEDHHATR